VEITRRARYYCLPAHLACVVCLFYIHMREHIPFVMRRLETVQNIAYIPSVEKINFEGGTLFHLYVQPVFALCK